MIRGGKLLAKHPDADSAAQVHHPAVNALDALDDAEDGRLSRAIGTDEADLLARVYRQACAIENHLRPKLLFNILKSQHGGRL